MGLPQSSLASKLHLSLSQDLSSPVAALDRAAVWAFYMLVSLGGHLIPSSSTDPWPLQPCRFVAFAFTYLSLSQEPLFTFHHFFLLPSSFFSCTVFTLLYSFLFHSCSILLESKLSFLCLVSLPCKVSWDQAYVLTWFYFLSLRLWEWQKNWKFTPKSWQTYTEFLLLLNILVQFWSHFMNHYCYLLFAEDYYFFQIFLFLLNSSFFFLLGCHPAHITFICHVSSGLISLD